MGWLVEDGLGQASILAADGLGIPLQTFGQVVRVAQEVSRMPLSEVLQYFNCRA